MLIFSTPPDQSAALVDANCVHVSPPSVLLKIPAPLRVLAPAPPPVPAYITLASAGLMAMALTARLARKSLTGWNVAPAFVLFHMPPPGLLTQMRFGSVGCTRIVVMRPPMFPGPSHVQAFRDTPAALARGMCATCSIARRNPSAGMRPFSSDQIMRWNSSAPSRAGRRTRSTCFGAVAVVHAVATTNRAAARCFACFMMFLDFSGFEQL